MDDQNRGAGSNGSEGFVYHQTILPNSSWAPGRETGKMAVGNAVYGIGGKLNDARIFVHKRC